MALGRTVASCALAVLALLPAAASALGRTTPRTAEFEQRVAPGLLDASATSASVARLHWRTTAPLRAPRRFDLLGVLWRGGEARVDVRVERRGGDWSRWTAISDADGLPARASGATHAAGPLWTGPARRYQLRVSRPLTSLRVRFVAVSDRTHSVHASAAGADGRPPIVARRRWDPGNACRPRTTPIYGHVDLALVHHTESLSPYSPAQSADMVLAICLFHRDGKGWNDIGYNLLVDRFGTVFEGRGGGVDQPVIGAHAQGWNSVSTGIAVIGSFSLAPPPPQTQRALARVLAWKLGLAGVPARGALVERSIGGDQNAHRTGAQVRFQRISGHRDGDLTDCPGGALYALLPHLRSLTAALAPAASDLLTISPVAAPQGQGDAVALSGRLAQADGRRPAGVGLVLQQRDGDWHNLASVTTGADGIWSAAPRLTQSGAVRVVDPVSGLASPAVQIPVRAGVRARATPRHLHAGSSLRVRGTTTPPKARVRLRVERLRRGRVVGVRTLGAATTTGRFDIPLRLTAAGVYRVIVTTRSDVINAAGISRALLVRVLKRR